MILGASGNFGKRIAECLARDRTPIILAGRNRVKLERLEKLLGNSSSSIACFDAFTELGDQLKALKPSVVINTCGPFQSGDYSIAKACLSQRVHYIDLADGRDFVTGISSLDSQARERGVSIISGASTVPGLSSAVLDHYKDAFASIETLEYGISPGQRAERGLATTQGILSYVGKPLKEFPNERHKVYGWQGIHRVQYPDLSNRWMANCDIPDLDLFPQHYDIKSIRFSAGLELGFLHLGLWALSWLVRMGTPIKLENHAAALLKASNWFNQLGSQNGGMHVVLQGRDQSGEPITRKWFIIAYDGHGPYIPTIPAINLAKRLARQQLNLPGAYPCIGLVTLDDYLDELKDFNVKTFTN